MSEVKIQTLQNQYFKAIKSHNLANFKDKFENLCGSVELPFSAKNFFFFFFFC